MTSDIHGSSGQDPSISTYQHNQTEGTGTTQTQSTQATQETTQQIIDRLIQSETPPEPRDDYQNNSGKPGLPSPTSNAPISEQTVSALYNTEQIQQFLTESLTQPLVAVDDQADVVVTDPAILALAQQLGISPGAAQKLLRTEDDSQFHLLTAGMTEEEINQLKFARAFPESAATLTPALQAKLTEINQSIAKSLGTAYGLPPSWKGVSQDTASFATTITAQFDTNFEQSIGLKLQDGTLTLSQATKLRTMHYVPGSFSNDKGLTDLFKSIEGDVVSGLRTQYGASATWTPAPNTTYFNLVTDGSFRQEFMTELETFQPPLSAQQKEWTIKSFANPDDPSIPADQRESIKNIVASIKATSISATVAKYGLDTSWSPSISTLVGPMLASVDYKLGMAALESATAVYNHSMALASEMPPSAVQSSFIDYLKTIGVALNDVQNFLYALSASDSEISKNLNRASSEMTLSSIATAQAKLAEAKRKERNTKKLNLGPLGDINGWMSKVMIVACTGGIGMVYVAAQITAESTGKPSIFQQMFKAINDLIEEHIPGSAGKILSSITTIVMIYQLAGSNPMLMMSMMSDAKSIQQMLLGCGCGSAKAELGTAVIMGTMQVAMAVAMMFCSGGSGGAAAATMIAKAIQGSAATAEAVAATAKTVATVMKVIAIVNLVVGVAIGSLQVTEKVMLCKWEFMKGGLAEMLSQVEAATEENRALVRAMKKVVDQLLAGMQANSDQLVTVQSFQGSKYASASQQTNDIAG